MFTIFEKLMHSLRVCVFEEARMQVAVCTERSMHRAQPRAALSRAEPSRASNIPRTSLSYISLSASHCCIHRFSTPLIVSLRFHHPFTSHACSFCHEQDGFP